jgi:1-acyl-sn-glycerol-3-phosphate acyltransferase
VSDSRHPDTDAGEADVVDLPLERGDAGSAEDVDEDTSIEALRVALDELRQEIRVRMGGESEEGRRPIDWVGLFEELRRRLNALGGVERSGHVDEFGMDEVTLRRMRGLLDFLYDRYWRVEVQGAENAPLDGPCLLVANRSGLLPYDGLMISHAVERRHPRHERPRFLVADWLITLPFVQPYLARIGGVRACRENADRLLRTGHSVVAFPEGVKGAAKVFRERYTLKRFGRGGVVRTALENRVPLVPVGVVGAEEAHPILFKAHLPARAVGLPFLPVTPTFPWMGPAGLLPLPSKWVLAIGEPLALDYPEPGAELDELMVSRFTSELRGRIQSLVEAGLEARTSVWG